MPHINGEECRSCKICLKCCMFKAIKFDNGRAIIEEDKCVNCMACLKNICPFDAIKEK